MNPTTRPLVSVVIPSYNCAPYLEEALASVQRQTLADHEVIVVDDGSTDDTVEILRRHEGPRLRLFTQHRRGPAAARNRGIENSTGRYVAFLDADDIWAPDKLAAQVDLMEAEPELGMCFTDWAWLASPAGTPSAFAAARPALERLEGRPAGGPARVLTGQRLLSDYLLRGPIPCWTSTVMVRRETLRRTGLFDERLRGGEDPQLWLRLLKTAPAGYIGRVLAWRRERPFSITTSTSDVENYRLSAEVAASLDTWVPLTREERVAVREAVRRARTAAGYCLMHAGDFPAARAEFRASLAVRFSMRAALYLAVTMLPSRLMEKVRGVRRQFSPAGSTGGTR